MTEEAGAPQQPCRRLHGEHRESHQATWVDIAGDQREREREELKVGRNLEIPAAGEAVEERVVILSNLFLPFLD